MTKILTPSEAKPGAAAPRRIHPPKTTRSAATKPKATQTAKHAASSGPSWPSSAARIWAQNIKPKDFVSIGPVRDDGSHNIQFTPDGADRARKLVAIFGFERLPGTAAELQQLLGYCRALDSTLPARVGRENAAQQQARALGNDEGRQYAIAWMQKHWPIAEDAVLLFAGADIRALRQLHARIDLMTVFGSRYENPTNKGDSNTANPGA